MWYFYDGYYYDLSCVYCVYFDSFGDLVLCFTNDDRIELSIDDMSASELGEILDTLFFDSKNSKKLLDEIYEYLNEKELK